MDEREYVTDLTDEQWQLIRQWIPARKPMGRKPISRREVINAILYLVHSGCQWRMLPSSFPNWNTVYGVFRQWKKDGIWERIHDALRRRVRHATPPGFWSVTQYARWLASSQDAFRLASATDIPDT